MISIAVREDLFVHIHDKWIFVFLLVGAKVPAERCGLRDENGSAFLTLR